LRGATVIGTVSTDEKAASLTAYGVDHVIVYTRQDFEAEVKRLTGGRGVQVVYDGVGRATFEKGLNVLARRGLMVLFGQTSGKVTQFDQTLLNTKGSLYLTCPTAADYISNRAELTQRTEELFDWILAGRLKLTVASTFPLHDAAQAHRALEARVTVGKVLLIP
jgi:NADPH2:quinone reductase